MSVTHAVAFRLGAQRNVSLRRPAPCQKKTIAPAVETAAKPSAAGLMREKNARWQAKVIRAHSTHRHARPRPRPRRHDGGREGQRHEDPRLGPHGRVVVTADTVELFDRER